MWIHIQIHSLLYVLHSCALYNKYIIVFTTLYLWKLVNISYEHLQILQKEYNFLCCFVNFSVSFTAFILGLYKTQFISTILFGYNFVTYAINSLDINNNGIQISLLIVSECGHMTFAPRFLLCIVPVYVLCMSKYVVAVIAVQVMFAQNVIVQNLK